MGGVVGCKIQLRSLSSCLCPAAFRVAKPKAAGLSFVYVWLLCLRPFATLTETCTTQPLTQQPNTHERYTGCLCESCKLLYCWWFKQHTPSFDASDCCYIRRVERIEQQVRFDVGELRRLLHNVEVLLCLWKLSCDVG